MAIRKWIDRRGDKPRTFFQCTKCGKETATAAAAQRCCESKR